jgi:hypothetical protein
MVVEIGRINHQIHDLAPILNRPSITDVKVESSNPDVPVEAIVKRHGDATYVFAVCMRGAKTTASFTVTGLGGGSRAKVLGEDRDAKVTDGVFRDTFQPWDVHLYEIRKD